MAEAHEAHFLLSRLAQPALRVVRLADLLQLVHHLRWRSTVGRTFERPDGADQARREVGVSRGDHARGEGGSIHAVVGKEHEVRVQRMHVLRARLLAVEHVEVVGSVAEVGAWLDWRQAQLTAMKQRKDGRKRGSRMNRQRDARLLQLVLDALY